MGVLLPIASLVIFISVLVAPVSIIALIVLIATKKDIPKYLKWLVVGSITALVLSAVIMVAGQVMMFKHLNDELEAYERIESVEETISTEE